MWLLLAFTSASFCCGNSVSDLDLNKVNDTIIMLKSIEVHSEKHELFSGSVKKQNIEPAILKNSYYADFSSILGTYTSVSVRSNGPGLLSITSLRGGSASHTATIWNGFNIQSPMLGQNDLSLMPAMLADEIQIQYGGGSSIWGTGAVGGAIIINNKPDFTPGQKYGYNSSLTTTGNFYNSIRTQWSNGVFATSLRLFHQQSKNQYNYINKNLSDNTIEKQENAGYDGLGLLQEIYYKPNNEQIFSIKAWYQQYERNIPPSLMFPDFETAQQNDDKLKITAQWQGLFNNLKADVKTGYFEDFIYYNDYMFTESESRSQMQISEAELRYYLHQQNTISLGFNHKFIQADVDDYSITPKEHLYTILASWRWNNLEENLITTINFRQKFAKEFDVEPTPALGITYKPFEKFAINANIVKSYRLPTLNDRYWSIGGNPDLLPESGWSQDVSFELSDISLSDKPETSGNLLSIDNASIALFHRNVSNWVSWAPRDDGFWSPQNILEVRSYGAEASKTISYSLGAQKINTSLFYSWTKSIYEKTGDDSDASLGNQLIYTPEHIAGINFSIIAGSFRLAYNHKLTGKRYTTSDNSAWLEPYDLADVLVAYEVELSKMNASLFIKAHNIWNQYYEEVEARPMPLRYFRIGLSINYN